MLNRWRRASLRVSLFIRFSVVLGLVLVVLLFISIQALDASTQQALKDRATVARLMADHVDTQLSRAEQLLQSGTDSEKLNLKDNDWQPEQRFLTTLYDRAVLFKHISLLDTYGRVLWQVPADESVIGKPVPGLPPLKSARELDAQPYASLVNLGSSQAVITITSPVFDAEGITEGYVLGWIDLADPRARSLLYPYQPGETGYSELIDLIDQRGAVLLSTRDDRIGQVSDHASRLSTLVQSKEATVGKCHSCHDVQGASRLNEILAFAPLKDIPMGIALHQPESEVLATTRSLTNQFIILGVVVLGLFLLAVQITTRGIAGPLGELSRVAQRIAGGDLSRPVRITNGAELISLGDSFEGMRQNLLHDREQLLGYQHDLVHRVNERTAELTQARDHLLETNRNLTEVNAVATLLARSLDLNETLQAATERLARGLSADACGVLLLDEQETTLGLAACYGLPANAVPTLRKLCFAETRAAAANPPGTTNEPSWCIACGKPLEEMLGWSSVLCTPLGTEGRLLGTLFVASRAANAFTQQDRTLLATIGWQFAVTVRKARLYETVRRREQERAELLHRTITAQEEERKRIARELHDETTQSLAALILGLDTAELARTADPQEASEIEQSAKTIARQTVEGLRRIIADLRPALLDDMGLVPAVAQYAKKRLQSAGIELRMEVDGLQESRLPTDQEIVLFRIIQEAINNVIRHAHASTVTIQLYQRDHSIRMQVADDGQGFALDADSDTGGDDGGFGLRGMQERVSIIGGSLEIETGPGEGTVVTVEVPVES